MKLDLMHAFDLSYLYLSISERSCKYLYLVLYILLVFSDNLRNTKSVPCGYDERVVYGS